MRTKTAFGAVIKLLFVLPVLAWGYSSGPPNGLTGAPGEGTCINCHDSFPINSGDGSLVISGPPSFQPGQTYQITLTITDPGQRRWGFEVTPLTHGSCGLLMPAHTQMAMQNGKTYVKHTTTGTFNGTLNGPVSWSFNWTAPSVAPAQVIFYAAGNAANGDGSSDGDYIYTATFVSNCATDLAEPLTLLPRAIALSNYPNPFNAATTITFDLPQADRVQLQVYDLLGHTVKTLVDDFRPAGTHTVLWSATDDSGTPVASGIYF